jgi:hypothetical protein
MNPKGGLGLRNLNLGARGVSATMRPMSPLARRLAAVAALFLSLAIVAVLGLRGMGFQVGFGPLANPTPVVATATPEPSEPAPSLDALTVFGQIEEQVRDLRQLPAAEIGPPQILTRAELAEVLPGLLEAPLDNETLRALGLLTADQDIIALTEQLYTAQVLGFYDFDAKRMVVVSDAGLTPAAEITYAHEYTHAMQDAAFDTSAIQKRVAGQRDQELALLGLEEGDATTSMVIWAIGHLSAQELAGITETPVPDMSGIPGWMVRLLEFPYLSGAEFVGRLYASGGWDAVDAAYADLPVSTEQILHPDAYIAGQAPIEVGGLDLGTALGVGWTNVTDTTLGEEWMAVWLEGIGVAQAPAEMAAAGWGGDHLTVASNPDGGWGLGWQIAWDAPIEATEFETAYTGAQAGLSFATRVVHISDRETIVLQASSPAVLDTIATLAGG